MTKNLLIETVKYVTGKIDSVSISGSPSRATAYRNVLGASRDLYEALNDRDANLKIVSALLTKKKSAAAHFKKVTGEAWPF
jgi:hypothetical protein